jgi:hypothetical protein
MQHAGISQTHYWICDSQRMEMMRHSRVFLEIVDLDKQPQSTPKAAVLEHCSQSELIVKCTLQCKLEKATERTRSVLPRSSKLLEKRIKFLQRTAPSTGWYLVVVFRFFSHESLLYVYHAGKDEFFVMSCYMCIRQREKQECHNCQLSFKGTVKRPNDNWNARTFC